jgi:hypothetical protein
VQQGVEVIPSYCQYLFCNRSEQSSKKNQEQIGCRSVEENLVMDDATYRKV